MQAAKGHNTGPAEYGSKIDPRAIMQTTEIKAARLKDKSAVKAEVTLYEGDWQCQGKELRKLQHLKRKQDIKGVVQTALLIYIILVKTAIISPCRSVV